VGRGRIAVLLVLTLMLTSAGIAVAGTRQGAPPSTYPRFQLDDNPPVPNNPADRLASRPLERLRGYFEEVPRRCRKAKPSGVTRFASWLGRNARRGSVGNRYRCENLGGGNGYSFHSEGRALDFTLNANKAADYAEARRLIALLLARDSAGRGAALARRMGIIEIIWDCSYWAQSQVDESDGSTTLREYFLCPTRSTSTAHRNHVHFSFTRAGAAGRTSFWRR
jgi:hypothetical protein